MTTQQLDEDGVRLYRRTGMETTVPGKPRVFPGVAYGVVRLCGWYPKPLLRAAPGSVVNGKYEYRDLDYTQLQATGPTTARDAYFTTSIVPPGDDLGFVCADFKVPREVLAAVGQDATTRTSYSPGWDAGAMSKTAFYLNGRVRFRVKPDGKMRVGIQQGADATDHREAFWGFNFGAFGGSFGTVIGGIDPNGGAGSLETLSGVSAGFSTPFSETTLFEVELLNDVVKFKRGGTVLASFSYASAPLWGRGSQVWSLGAAIFDPGAWVDGLEVTQYDGANLVGPAAALKAGQGSVKIGGAVITPRPVVTGRIARRANATTPAARVRASNYVIGEAAFNLPRAEVSAGYFTGTTFPFGRVRMPRPRTEGRSLVGTVGRANLGAGAAKLNASVGNRGAAALVAPSMVVFGADEGIATEVRNGITVTAYSNRIFTHGGNKTTLAGVGELVVLMNTAGSMATTIAAAMIAKASLNSSGAASTSVVLSSIIAELMRTSAAVGSDIPLSEQPNEVWVVNLANNATSTFENYPFNSFGVLGGRAFGLKGDGLYLLEGSTDDGQPIRASVSYGQQDFGSKTMKNMARAYVGASSAGKLLLRVTADGITYTYEARDFSTTAAQQRFDVGRGLQANYFTFELVNQDGADFEIDGVSFFAAEFKRRI
jgi:hypothetical protein